MQNRTMKPLIFLTVLLGLALGQTQRWSGALEYRSFPGATTAAGPQLDRSYAVIYPSQAARKGTVILVPGFLGGAGSFDPLAARLVMAAPGWEVWAWDRRANGLEDRRGLATADPWAYYQNYTLPEVGFLKDWGLAVHLADLDNLVEVARREGPVVLAGHSLGASLASAYAQRYGEKLSGLIWLDGAPNTNYSSEEQYRRGGQGAFGNTAGLEQLMSGQARPYVQAFFLDPAFLARSEALAYLASINPTGDAPAGAVKFRSSLEAAALSQIDDRYNTISLFSVAAGRAQAREGFNLLALLQGSVKFSVRGPSSGRRVEWADTGEATDPREFLRAYASLDTGFGEWFFPYRLSLDLGAWSLAVPELKPRKLTFPILALGAGSGIVTQPQRFLAAQPVFPDTPIQTLILPNLTHLDILSGRRGPAVAPIAAYLAGLPRNP
jgi:pimeloyl-ACP methyl ester carboxylesterase